MTVADAVAELAAEIEASLLTDVCTIRLPDAEPHEVEFDPSTWEPTGARTSSVLVAGLACLASTTAHRQTDDAGKVVALAVSRVRIPIGAVAVPSGSFVEFTVSTNPSLVGVVWGPVAEDKSHSLAASRFLSADHEVPLR